MLQKWLLIISGLCILAACQDDLDENPQGFSHQCTSDGHCFVCNRWGDCYGDWYPACYGDEDCPSGYECSYGQCTPVPVCDDPGCRDCDEHPRCGASGDCPGQMPDGGADPGSDADAGVDAGEDTPAEDASTPDDAGSDVPDPDDACEDAGTVPQCVHDEDCAPNEVCRDGECRQTCTCTCDCASRLCVDGVCEEAA
jgi:hypothetical protein